MFWVSKLNPDLCQDHHAHQENSGWCILHEKWGYCISVCLPCEKLLLFFILQTSVTDKNSTQTTKIWISNCKLIFCFRLTQREKEVHVYVLSKVSLRGHNWMHFAHRPKCTVTLNLANLDPYHISYMPEVVR